MPYLLPKTEFTIKTLHSNLDMTKPKILHLGLCVQPQPFNGLQTAFMRHSSHYAELNTGDSMFNSRAVQMAMDMKPDIVFMQIQCAGVIHKSTVQVLRANGAFVVNWNGDVRDTVPGWMAQIGNDVNLSLFTNMRDVREMRAMNLPADWLEIGYDPEIYTPEGPVTQTADIVFFGNNAHSFPMSGFRNRMCQWMKAKFGDRFKVYGLHQGADGNFNHSQRDEAAAYRSAKIAINVSHYEIEKYTSDRMLRILGTGKPLCLAKRYPGIEDQFKDFVHFRLWDRLEELEALCHYYLDASKESERAGIAASGQELISRTLTFDNMVQNLISLYNYYNDKTQSNRVHPAPIWG